MAKIVDFIRAIPGGTGVNSVSVALKKHVDDATVTTVTSNASGQFTYQADGSPGPLYATATTGDRTRARSGKATGQIGTWFGSDIPVALRSLGNGVIRNYSDPGVANEQMAVAIGTGLQVTVAPGAAIIDGHVYRCTASTPLTIGGNTSGVTRVDRIVIRFTREGQTEEGKCVLAVSAGTPGAGAPAVVQSNATWELSLATVSVANGASGLSSGNVVDTREFATATTLGVPTSAVLSAAVTGSSIKAYSATAVTTSNTTVDSFNLGPLTDGVTYDVFAYTMMQAKAPSGGFIDALIRIEASSSSIEGSRTGLSTGEHPIGAFTAKTVVGDGTAINIAARAKTSTGSGEVMSAVTFAVAIPRKVTLS